MENADAELKRRRERGKLSQRAFRSRQALALQELRAENAQLKEAITELVNLDLAKPETLRLAIERAAGVAGLQMKPHKSRNLPHATQDTTSDVVIPETLPQMNFPIQLGLDGLAHNLVDLGRSYQQIEPPSTICMTFRLEYGLLGSPDSLERIMQPPLDIVPYLGSNKHRLASQIYWYCTEKSLGLLYHLGGRHRAGLIYVAQHHPFFVAMLRYVIKHSSYDYIIALAEARLDFYRLGYCRASNPAATWDSSSHLKDYVEHAHNAAELESQDWCNDRGVAQAVEEVLERHGLLAQFEAALRNGDTVPATRKVLNELLQKLWLEGTCFGDGSRWKMSFVKNLLIWLVRALQSCH